MGCHMPRPFDLPSAATRARDGVSGRLPRVDLHRQQLSALMELSRHLLANGWRSLRDPPDLLLLLDCLLQLYGQPPLALLPHVHLPEYPHGPLSDCVSPAVQDELKALNTHLATNDISVGSTHALPLALQHDGTREDIGLQSLACLLEGARRPVPSISHEPDSVQQL